MSVISDLTTSRPASICGVESLGSDTASTHATEDKGSPATHTPFGVAASKYIDSNAELVYEVPSLQEDFSFEDGDACVLAGNILVATHKYLLKRFKKLGDRIKDGILVLGLEDHTIEEFRNTLKILYATVIDASSDFDPPTLISALRLATTYEYPALRAFAIKRLEDATLSAINRIRLAREFDLPLWEESAYTELCERDKAITTSEASVLGLDAFVRVAKIREKEQRRRGRDIDAAIGAKDDESAVGPLQISGQDPYAVGLLRSTPVSPEPFSAYVLRMRKEAERARLAGAEDLSKTGGVVPQVNHNQKAGAKDDEKKAVEVPTKPRFIDTQIPDTHHLGWTKPKTTTIELPVADCNCEYRPGNTVDGCPYEGEKCVCKLPPCAVRAFKNLQIQQATHANTMAKLEAAIAEIQTPQTPPTLEHCIPVARPLSTTAESVRGGVLRWLDGCKNQIGHE